MRDRIRKVIAGILASYDKSQVQSNNGRNRKCGGIDDIPEKSSICGDGVFFTCTNRSTKNNQKSWIKYENFLKASKRWKREHRTTKQKHNRKWEPREGGSKLERQSHLSLKASANPGKPGPWFQRPLCWVGPVSQALVPAMVRNFFTVPSSY